MSTVLRALPFSFWFGACAVSSRRAEILFNPACGLNVALERALGYFYSTVTSVSCAVQDSKGEKAKGDERRMWWTFLS